MNAEIAQLFPSSEEERESARRLAEAVRIAEALLFAAAEPVAEDMIARRLAPGVSLAPVLARLRADYAGRGIGLCRVADKWFFRTAEDLAWLLSPSGRERRQLSRAAMETLAIIAYHQPATRAEIEAIRGVAVAKGTVDALLDTGWVRLRGRRRSPGQPITYGTTEAFLLHFGLATIADLPGLDELRGTGFFDAPLPSGFSVPLPDDGALRDDEDSLDAGSDQDDAALDEDPLREGEDGEDGDEDEEWARAARHPGPDE